MFGVGVVAPQRTGQVCIYIEWWREEGEGVDVLEQRERLGDVSKALGVQDIGRKRGHSSLAVQTCNRDSRRR